MKGVKQSGFGPVLVLDSGRALPLGKASNYKAGPPPKSEQAMLGKLCALRGWGFDVEAPPPNEESIEWTT